MMKKGKSRKIVLKPVAKNCMFCNSKTEPDYKNYQEVARFVNERGKILGRARTGICAKHQRRLGIAIKRARHLGLVSYASAH